MLRSSRPPVHGLPGVAFATAHAGTQDLNLYTGTLSPAQEFSAAKELGSPDIAQPARQHDFGISFEVFVSLHQ